MRILLSDNKGFIGKNLYESLNNIMTGKDRTYELPVIENVDVVEDILGNREIEIKPAEMEVVYILDAVDMKCGGKLDLLYDEAEKNNKLKFIIPYYKEDEDSRKEYERIKKLFDGLTVVDIPLFEVFGKWDYSCKKNTVNKMISHCAESDNASCVLDLPENINVKAHYIDEVIRSLIECVKKHDDSSIQNIPVYEISKEILADNIEAAQKISTDFVYPKTNSDDVGRRITATYLSYLPEDKVAFLLPLNTTDRRIYYDVYKTVNGGQISLNDNAPSTTKGQHWHHSKWEIFVVVSGHGIIEQRQIGTDNVIRTEIQEGEVKAIYTLPGYAHNLINLSDKEHLYTMIWADTTFDPEYPDTYRECV